MSAALDVGPASTVRFFKELRNTRIAIVEVVLAGLRVDYWALPFLASPLALEALNLAISFWTALSTRAFSSAR